MEFTFRNSCVHLVGSPTFVNLEVRFMTGLQFPDLMRLSKPLLPSSPSDDRRLTGISGKHQLDILDSAGSSPCSVSLELHS